MTSDTLQMMLTLQFMDRSGGRYQNTYIYIYIHNNPFKGIGVKDFYRAFFLGVFYVRPFFFAFVFVFTIKIILLGVLCFATTTFRKNRAVGTGKTRRIDPRIPEAPKS